MTAAVHQLLNSFEALPPREKHEVAVEILRRVGDTDDLSDATLIETADDLFRTLDAVEERDAAS